jgi:hypothetical protein
MGAWTAREVLDELRGRRDRLAVGWRALTLQLQPVAASVGYVHHGIFPAGRGGTIPRSGSTT